MSPATVDDRRACTVPGCAELAAPRVGVTGSHPKFCPAHRLDRAERAERERERRLAAAAGDAAPVEPPGSRPVGPILLRAGVKFYNRGKGLAESSRECVVLEVSADCLWFSSGQGANQLVTDCPLDLAAAFVARGEWDVRPVELPGRVPPVRPDPFGGVLDLEAAQGDWSHLRLGQAGGSP